MDRDIVDIARSAYQAYAESDRAALEKVIAGDFHFTSPLDNRINRTTYFERCWPNHRFIEDFCFVHIVRDGERVFVTYEGRNAAGARFRNTEILTIRQGKIVEAEVFRLEPAAHGTFRRIRGRLMGRPADPSRALSIGARHRRRRNRRPEQFIR
jgi:ketosteroid isomerase-like protein